MAEQIGLTSLARHRNCRDRGNAIGREESGEEEQLLFQIKFGHDKSDDSACCNPQYRRSVAARRQCADRRDGRVFTRFLGKGFHLLRAIFFRRKDGPQHRDQQRCAAEPETVAHRVRHPAARCDIGDADRFQQIGKYRSHHRARSDERGLHRITRRMLIFAKHIADEGAERLHGYVERGIENPQHHCGEPESRTVGHHEQRQSGQHRACQEIGTAAAQPAPGAIRIMADDRLDQQPGQRGCDPECGEIVERFSERLKDAAHIRILQREADLDAEETEADIPQPPESLARLARLCCCLVHIPSPGWTDSYVIGAERGGAGGAAQSRPGRERPCIRMLKL